MKTSQEKVIENDKNKMVEELRIWQNQQANEVYREIDEMEAAVRKQMELVREINSTKIMKLNVGGVKFEVARETLTKVEGSHMAEFFKGEQ